MILQIYNVNIQNICRIDDHMMGIKIAQKMLAGHHASRHTGCIGLAPGRRSPLPTKIG